MNEQQRQELITLFEQEAKSIGAVRGWCDTQEATLKAIRDRVFADVLEGGERVLFASPVTSVVGDVWGGSWYDATGYATYYTATGKPAYHTGADLNMPNFADAGKPVYAAADGEVVFSGIVPGWQGQVCVIEVPLEDGSKVWLRYAHIDHALGLGSVKRGAVVGRIADYNKDGAKGDHLHYDVALKDISGDPGDWPGNDRARVLRDYTDPAKFHTDRGG